MIAFLMVCVCSAATILSVASLWLLTRRRRLARGPVDAELGITVLKPLCGADEALEENLDTFFRQEHPRFELLFGVQDVNDPALAVVKKLRARHPDVRARVVVHSRRDLNPKVANLRGMLASGSHDLVVVSDSNVAVGPRYLAEMAARFAAPRVGLVTSLFCGVGEKTLGSALESLQLAGPIAGSVAASEVLGGHAVVVGKSMMFRRSVLDRLGGLESVASVLAEDYVMGRMFHEAGYEVRVCAEVIRNVTQRATLKQFFRRQVRWGLLRSRIKPLMYPFEPLVSPLGTALAALVLGAPAWVLLWALGLTFARDALSWLRLRGARRLWLVALGPVKDLIMLAAWVVAPFQRTVEWRGHKLRVSAGTRLYAEGVISSAA